MVLLHHTARIITPALVLLSSGSPFPCSLDRIDNADSFSNEQSRGREVTQYAALLNQEKGVSLVWLVMVKNVCKFKKMALQNCKYAGRKNNKYMYNKMMFAWSLSLKALKGAQYLHCFPGLTIGDPEAFFSGVPVVKVSSSWHDPLLVSEIHFGWILSSGWVTVWRALITKLV